MQTIKPSPRSGHIVVLSGNIKHVSKWIQPEYNVFTTLVTLETKTQFISEAALDQLLRVQLCSPCRSNKSWMQLDHLRFQV